MLDSFRSGGANSPETFVTAIAATLARYPDKVIYEVTDPRTGIPAQLSWMPTIKDVNDACERAMLPIRAEQDRKKRIAEQMAAREEEDRKPRPTLQQMEEKYGHAWGIAQNGRDRTLEARWADFPAPTKEQLSAHYREHGLAFQPKRQDAAE